MGGAESYSSKCYSAGGLGSEYSTVGNAKHKTAARRQCHGLTALSGDSGTFKARLSQPFLCR